MHTHARTWQALDEELARSLARQIFLHADSVDAKTGGQPDGRLECTELVNIMVGE